MTTPSIRQPGASARGARPIQSTASANGPTNSASPANGGFVYAEYPDPRFAPVPRLAAQPRAVAPAPARRRPDPSSTRLMFGVLGLASAAAFTTAMLPSISPADASDTSAAADPNAVDPNAVDPNAVIVAPEPSVRHVTQYVTLAPGQTAPPKSTVIVRPKPTPKVTVKVVTRTRQSGKP
jgi:hypothetical protein